MTLIKKEKVKFAFFLSKRKKKENRKNSELKTFVNFSLHWYVTSSWMLISISQMLSSTTSMVVWFLFEAPLEESGT